MRLLQDAVIQPSEDVFWSFKIDREAIEASATNEGAFVELTKFSVQRVLSLGCVI
jgi:hypothetical protein